MVGVFALLLGPVGLSNQHGGLRPMPAMLEVRAPTPSALEPLGRGSKDLDGADFLLSTSHHLERWLKFTRTVLSSIEMWLDALEGIGCFGRGNRLRAVLPEALADQRIVDIACPWPRKAQVILLA